MGAATSDFLGLEELLFPAPALSYDQNDDRLVWFRSTEGGHVPALLIRRQDQNSKAKSSSVHPALPVHLRTTSSIMIYFHANGCDIGHAASEADYITFHTGMDVLIPEYPGYGLLDGYRSTISGVNGVARAALQFVTDYLQIPPSRVVLFGRSIGTGPACAMASECQQMGLPIGAVILVAPYLTLKKLILKHAPIAQDMAQDHWDNQTALECCSHTSLLIIHGQNDKVIPYTHGRTLYSCASTLHKMGYFPNWLAHNHWKSEESFSVIKRFLQKRTSSNKAFIDDGVEHAFSSECPGGENLILTERSPWHDKDKDERERTLKDDRKRVTWDAGLGIDKDEAMPARYPSGDREKHPHFHDVRRHPSEDPGFSKASFTGLQLEHPISRNIGHQIEERILYSSEESSVARHNFGNVLCEEYAVDQAQVALDTVLHKVIGGNNDISGNLLSKLTGDLDRRMVRSVQQEAERAWNVAEAERAWNMLNRNQTPQPEAERAWNILNKKQNMLSTKQTPQQIKCVQEEMPYHAPHINENNELVWSL